MKKCLPCIKLFHRLFHVDVFIRLWDYSCVLCNFRVIRKMVRIQSTMSELLGVDCFEWRLDLCTRCYYCFLVNIKTLFGFGLPFSMDHIGRHCTYAEMRCRIFSNRHVHRHLSSYALHFLMRRRVRISECARNLHSARWELDWKLWVGWNGDTNEFVYFIRSLLIGKD